MRGSLDEDLAKVPGVTAQVIEGLRSLFAELDGESVEPETFPPGTTPPPDTTPQY